MYVCMLIVEAPHTHGHHHLLPACYSGYGHGDNTRSAVTVESVSFGRGEGGY